MKTQILCALIVLTSVSCRKNKPLERAKVRPVRVKKVLSTGSDRVRKLSGTSKAGASSVLSFKVGGTVEEVAVRVGDRVDKGQLIAKLDPRDYELQLQEARAALAQARAQQRNAKSSYDRVRALWENQNAARGDLDTARAAYETASASVSSVSKRLQLVRRQLDYCVLKTTVAGAIATVTAENGENVSPGQPIALLTSGSKPEVAIEVPEALISRIARGNQVAVTFDSMPKKSFTGVVSEVGIAPATGATTFPVTIRIEGEAKAIRPGLAAEVEFRFVATGAKNRFLVPAFSVQSDAKGPFVFIAKPGDPGTVERRIVEVGELTEDGLEVTKGLNDGELLVTAGVTKLKDGQTVKVPETP